MKDYFEVILRGSAIANKAIKDGFLQPRKQKVSPIVNYEIYDDDGRTLKIYKNPSLEQVYQIGKNKYFRFVISRGVIFNGNFYVVDHSGLHAEILDYLIKEKGLIDLTKVSTRYFDLYYKYCSLWQLQEVPGAKTYLFSESYSDSFDNLENENDDNIINIKGNEIQEKIRAAELKQIINNQIQSLPAKVKSEFNFKLLGI